MEEFKTLSPSSSVVKIIACLEKIYKKICESREKQIPEYNIKEIEFLKTQCRSDNVQVSLLSGQTMVRLVECNALDAPNVLMLLLSMIQNASSTQVFTITEAIVDLLLLSLKRKTSMLKQKEPFKCPFGMRTQQHPLIALLQCPTINMHNIASKMRTISRHHDPDIRDYSVEYLRPVFLYILCNPQTLPDCKSVWTDLLALSKTNANVKSLVREILCWSKFSNSPSCLFTSALLIDAIEHYLDHKDLNSVTELSIFQALLINHLGKFGIDPRPSLRTLLTVLNATKHHQTDHYNVLLVLLAESVHRLAPIYLPDLFRLLHFIIVEENCGHQYILNMCLDGIIQWMSQIIFTTSEGLTLAHLIIRKILEKANENEFSQANVLKFPTTDVRYFHPDIAIAFDLVKLVESFDKSEFKDLFAFVDALNIKSNTTFCQRMHLFLRALFMSKDPAVDCWFKIYEIILELIKVNNNIGYDFLMTYLFKLAGEKNPEIQLELLRGLPNFGVAKDNVPMILNTIRNLVNDNPEFCMDLYLRLWRVEVRTYPFLLKLLAQPPKDVGNRWEYQIAKAHTIREICYDKPGNYGAELVSQLSDILNASTDETGDIATAIALDAIVVLCESHTINITSTWHVLSAKFSKENRPHSLKSLFNFFSKVPSLQTPTLEYERLVDEALHQLWSTVTNSDAHMTIVRDALNALKYFEIGTLQVLRHIPHQFRQGLSRVREYTAPNGREVVDLQADAIPGECWVQLLQKIRPDCGSAAADLISHYISNEISEFRGGMYRIPEGKPEPHKLQGLLGKSPLRAVVNYLVSQSHMGDLHIREPLAVTNALRAICKKFSKPIPPVDWCFLHSFFHLSFDARKYCILIAKNQLLHSGTASRLLENFLIEFEPNCFEEDLLLLFSVMPDIANGVNLVILKNFLEKVVIYCFKESKLSNFAEGCLFENFLESAKSIFTENCEKPEVRDLFTLVIERYMDSMDLESRVFERYTEVVALLSTASIDGLTSPTNWWETPIGKLKKAIIIRCYLVLYNEQLANPLKWLDPIIDAFSVRTEERHFFYHHLAATLYAFNNDQHACNWIMGIFMQVHKFLADDLPKKLDKVLYLIDIIMLSSIVLSGCAILQGNLNVVASDRNERFEMFPESLLLLCEHVFWKDQEAKIYEFLYNLYKNPSIPNEYANTFKNAVICSRNQAYFEHKANWMKYVGMRK